jgi:hypothetical protein
MNSSPDSPNNPYPNTPLLSDSSPERQVIDRQNLVLDVTDIIDSTKSFLIDKRDKDGIDEEKELNERIRILEDLKKRYTAEFNRQEAILHVHRTSPGTQFIERSQSELDQAQDDNYRLLREKILPIDDDILALNEEKRQLKERVGRKNVEVNDNIQKLTLIKQFILRTNPSPVVVKKKSGCCPCLRTGGKTKKMRFFKSNTKNVYSKNNFSKNKLRKS